MIRGVVNGPDPENARISGRCCSTHPACTSRRPISAAGSTPWSMGRLREADVVVFMIDATMPIGPGDRLIAERLQRPGPDVVVVVNKVDAASRGETIEQLAKAGEWDFAVVCPGVRSRWRRASIELLDEIVDRLPEGPLLLPGRG